MTRSLLALILLAGTALANPESLFRRQTDNFPTCGTNCLKAYLSATTCPSITTDETGFIKCMCADTSTAATNFVTCITSTCSQTDLTTIKQGINALCGGSTGSTNTTPVNSLAPTPSKKVVTTTASAPLVSSTGSLGTCTDSCFNTYLKNTKCSSDDVQCMCNDDSTVAQDLISCVKKCPADQASAFANTIKSACATATGSPPTATLTKSAKTTPISNSTSDTSGLYPTVSVPTVSRSTPAVRTTSARSTVTAPPASGIAGINEMHGSFVAMVGGVVAAVLAL